jgi:hypothetical protein
MNEHLITDLRCAQPAAALSDSPRPDTWLTMPYSGEVSGTMVWSPARNRPPDLSVPLPPLGRCEIHVGIYSSGTVPYWFTLLRPPKNDVPASTATCYRVCLRLSDEDWFEEMEPDDYPGQPRFTHVSEKPWKVADVTGRSLVFRAPGVLRESFMELSSHIAYIRLVPVAGADAGKWPADTRRLVAYQDCMHHGHYVGSREEVKGFIMPLRDSDCGTLLWTTCREDTCYYPSKVGNPFPDHGMRGVYPYWTGRDLRRMLDAGDDPLRAVCDVAHACGLQVFGSYRRMTCRMPPFVYPLHPEALFVRRPDLWCADERGAPIPHLSLAYPEVRQRMVSLLVEQATEYDLDGVHLFLCRGVPFVFFEKPFRDAFREEHGADPAGLPLDDERVWRTRARFVVGCLREVRAALDEAGRRRGRRVQLALSVFNSPRNCLFYGLDLEAIVRERLADLLLPARASFLPREMGELRCLPELVAEIAKLASGSGIRVCPECQTQYPQSRVPGRSREDLAADLYRAGADGLQLWPERGCRLGHARELLAGTLPPRRTGRRVRVDTVAGFPLDHTTGIPTNG